MYKLESPYIPLFKGGLKNNGIPLPGGRPKTSPLAVDFIL